MQDMEDRIKQETKESLIETSRQVQGVLSQIKGEQQTRDESSNRIADLELKVNGHF